MIDITDPRPGHAIQDLSLLMAMPSRWMYARPRGQEALRLLDAGYTCL
jgi:hypothetical protein